MNDSQDSNRSADVSPVPADSPESIAGTAPPRADPLPNTDNVSSPADERRAHISDPNAATGSFADVQGTVSFAGADDPGTAFIPPGRNAPIPEVPGYEIVGVLGRGGMGVVYKARHLALKRMVALKMILSGGHAGEAERLRFRSEAEAVARLQHPNIVQVHEVGEHDGLPYAALEFVEGGTFAQRLKRSPVSPREAAELIATVAGAMHLAHSRNIVHRDLKPANILLDTNGSPKVSDFGLARQLDSDSSQTQTGTAVGTPSYMAPEQAAGDSKHVGPAADVYALGAILYECLTGRPPFQGGSIIATLDMVRNAEPVAPHVLRRAAPRDLETICLKCLRKEPDKRYASADALANDLHRWLRGEPIRARPVPMWERGLLWARRRPALAALGVVLILSVAALVGGGIWSYSEISLALADANAAKLKSQRMSAGLALDRGLQECEAGKVAAGMLWLAESLAVNPEEDRLLADVLRLNLAAWRATMTVPRTLVDHERAVGCVAYSPDGKIVAIAHGGTVTRRDALTGEPVGQALVHKGDVASLAFSHDGRLLATGSYDRSVRIWDLASGKRIGQPIPQPNVVNSVAFSPDDRWVLAATGFRSHSEASSARVWDVATGKPVSAPLAHPKTVRAGVFTHDGRFAITGGHDGVLRFWDTTTWQLSGAPMKLPAQVWALALSRDGVFLAVGGSGNDGAFVCSVRDRRVVSASMRHTRAVQAIAFHPDEGLLATGCNDSFGRLWDWRRGEQVCPPLVHQNYVRGVDFSPDGRRLITGADDKCARIWDLPLYARKGIPLTESDPKLMLGHLDSSLTSGRPHTRITGAAPAHNRPIPHWVREYIGASFSPDGRYVVTGSIDHSARVFEVATGRLIGKPLRHQNWVRSVAFAPDNEHVLTGSHDMTAQLWDINTGQRCGPTLHHQGAVVSVAISPDGTRALTGSAKAARLWNLQTGQAIGPPMPHTAEVAAVSFSNRGALALTGDGSGTVRLWDSATALPIGPPARHHGGVTSVRFADDDRSFLTLCADGIARRWAVPVPVAGDPALVKMWVQAITGEEQDAGKAGSVTGAAAWRERRGQVMDSPLGADLEPGPGAAVEAASWHDGMAGAFEASKTPEAALWHLDRLSALRPTDWSLHVRRAGVLHRSSRDAEARKALDQARALGGLEPVRGWCAERAENLERLHRHEAALWFHEWLVAADPNNAEAHDAIGHCQARLGRFAEASEHFTRAVALAPDRIAYQRDLALACLAQHDAAGYQRACARMIELALATEDRDAAHMTVLTCVLDPNAVPKWDAVIRLAARAAEGYDGDYRIHVAALFRAGHLTKALERPWSKATKYTHIVWEWLFQGMLRHQAGRHEEARALLDEKIKLIDHMDRTMRRDPTSRIWSDWMYYVQCHVLGSEAQALLRRSRIAAGTPNSEDRLWLAQSCIRAGKPREALAAVKDDPYLLCKLAGLFDEDREALFADEARSKARGLFEQQLATERHNPALASDLAHLLLSGRRAQWTVLKPAEMKSAGGWALMLEDDGSILAQGGTREAEADTLLVEANAAGAKAIKIETSTHAAPPKDGRPFFNEYQILTTRRAALAAGVCTGRYVRIDLPGDNRHFPRLASDGDRKELNLAELQVFQGDRNIALHKSARQSSIWQEMVADRAVDGNTDGQLGGGSMAHTDARNDGNNPWWEVDLGSEQQIDRMVVWNRVSETCGLRMSHFRIRVLDTSRNVVFEQFFVTPPEPSREIRFRASVTTSETGGKDRMVLRLVRNPRQEPTARFRLSVTSDLAEIAQEDGRATVETIANPWAKLAAAYHVSGGPQGATLALKVAALQAWFGQHKELAATRRRILVAARGTNDVVTAERAARVCTIVPSTDKAEIDAALVLARKAIEAGKGGDRNLLALGMAQYRCGNDAAAEEALLAALKASPNNRIVTGIAAFYRAMSLCRQGKRDLARKLATEATAQMKPLPKDEQNPLANNARWDDLLLWLAYKEAKAMIDQGEAPPPLQLHHTT